MTGHPSEATLTACCRCVDYLAAQPPNPRGARDVMSEAAILLHDRRVPTPATDAARAVLHQILASRENTTVRTDLAREILEAAERVRCPDCATGTIVTDAYDWTTGVSQAHCSAQCGWTV